MDDLERLTFLREIGFADKEWMAEKYSGALESLSERIVSGDYPAGMKKRIRFFFDCGIDFKKAIRTALSSMALDDDEFEISLCNQVDVEGPDAVEFILEQMINDKESKQRAKEWE